MWSYKYWYNKARFLRRDRLTEKKFEIIHVQWNLKILKDLDINHFVLIIDKYFQRNWLFEFVSGTGYQNHLTVMVKTQWILRWRKSWIYMNKCLELSLN